MTSVEDFNCILCKESFDNKDELQTHFRKHGDPKFHESLKSKNRVQNEAPLPLTNEKSNDASEMVNCDVCEEMFPTISKAITHKHKVHPEHDAKYFCPWCGKLFTMKHLYNKHLQTNHDTTEETSDSHDNHFHCDCCSVYFYLSSAMIYHNKFFHRQDTDLPIIGHSKKQKRWHQDWLPVYFCSFCGEEYINKVNLHKHICDDHGEENQRPTDVLRCPLCEAIFYHLDAYELHLTFHSSDDTYSEANEMNENELSEYSLETVPPSMERIEDLNNLPDVETDVNAVGIESFLQMAMDEPLDSNQRPKKVKSKKHKKHKKSKKSAITLDEFLNMNQDVFGEGLDFQGVQVQEVPTKVIKRQLIPRKPQLKKTGAKLVSSADLQKLQKAGIVVKMKSGSKPPPLHVRPIGQPVKVNPRVKNLTNQTQTKAISASDEVLSKLMNQSSNQLKIVKKSTLEKTNNDEHADNESVVEDTKNQSLNEGLASPKNVEMDSSVENSKNEEADLNAITNLNVLENKNKEKYLNDCVDNQEASNNNTTENLEENIKNINENNDDTTNLNINQKTSPCGNSNVTSGNDLKDTLKNISRHITIKSVTSPSIKPHVQSDLDKPVSLMGDQLREFVNHCNNELKTDVNSINKSLDPLRNINSDITIKSQKNGNIATDSRNSTIVDEKTEPSITQSPVNIPDKIPVQGNRTKIEKASVSAINKHGSDKIKATTSSDILRNLSKNITVKSTSPSINHLKEDNPNKQQDDDVFHEYDENPIQNNDIQKDDSTNIGVQAAKSSNVLKNLSKNITIKSMSPSIKKIKEDTTDKKQYNSEFDEYDENPVENENFQSLGLQDGSSSNVLKNLNKNITVKSTSPSIKQLKVDNTNIEQQDSEFDEDDETPIVKRNIQKIASANFLNQSAASSNVLKNLSQNITVKSTSPSIKQLKVDKTNNDQHDSEFDEDDETPIAKRNIQKFASTNFANQMATSSNVLKNLSQHITVKSTSPSTEQLKIDNTHNEQHDSEFDEDDETPIEKRNTQKVASTNVGIHTATSSHVLKNLSKNITIKSTSQSIKQLKGDNTNKTEDASEFHEFDEYDASPIENKNIRKVVSTNLGLLKNASPRAKFAPDGRQTPISNLNSNNVQPELKEENMSEKFTDSKNSNVTSSSNILKHLKNITAKPVMTSNKTQQITATSSNNTVKIAKENNYTWKSVQKNETTEEIETFNIDDSDSDDGGQQQIQQTKTASEKVEPIKKEAKPIAALNAFKNMSKDITVKSSNNQTKQTKHCEDIDRHVSDIFSDSEFDEDAISRQFYDNFKSKQKNALNKIPPTAFKATTQKEETFKKVFKNLGKHITVKSKSSSSQSIHHTSQDLKQNTHHTANDESDEDPIGGKVKITEVTDDNFSDEDIDNVENKGIVTHSSEVDSGDDNFPEDMDEFDEYESRPQVISHHNLKSPSEGLLQNISKNITVKSLNERNIENVGRSSNNTPSENDQLGNNKFSSKLSVRPINHNKPDIRNESATSRSQGGVNTKRVAGASNSNQSTNLVVPESSGVVNTVNKEVNVKTFQSETVIEEVTTTVTKTIRRVNQVNQQVFNASQTSTMPKINQQKSGPRMGNYNQQTKNLQGTIVRQTAPGMISPKIRQAIPYRPVAGTPIRPSNQLVPIRPNANIRPNSNPRMQMKNMPPQQRAVGKPLKIAPNAMNQIKRPAPENTTGPFSCFKKPKESLIPGNETAAGSSDFHFASSSQTSKFSSTAKIVKGNAVVTKTQIRSESTQQQQMSRHGNISGLKIAQSKQVSQVERSEVSASKRSALEAIEKLQKQGLLIKKPRVVEEDFEPSNSDGEHNEEFQDEDE